MQRRKAQFIGDLIRGAMQNDEILKKGVQESNIVTSWREIVGEKLFNSTTKLYIRDQKLFVEFSSAIAKREFYNNRYDILNRINQTAGKILIKFIYVL